MIALTLIYKPEELTGRAREFLLTLLQEKAIYTQQN